MFTEELKHKYTNHSKKAKAYDPTVFNELYDQFLSLYYSCHQHKDEKGYAGS